MAWDDDDDDHDAAVPTRRLGRRPDMAQLLLTHGDTLNLTEGLSLLRIQETQAVVLELRVSRSKK